MQPTDLSMEMTEHDRQQADELRRARIRATGLLAVVTVAFVASFALPETLGTGYLRAALEAGLVGGLADWFAVVALFRHPLGLPIPHTAVIPESKDRLGENLAIFVRDNFLSGEKVQERIADPAHVERLGEWLSVRAHAESVAVQLAQVGVAALDALDEEEMVDRITAAVRRRLHAVPIARLGGMSLEQAIRQGRHADLVELAIEGLLDVLGRHRTSLRKRLVQQAPPWVPGVVNDLVFDRAEDVVRNFLRQIATDEQHELRQALDEQLLTISQRLQRDTELAGRLNDAATDAISDEQLQVWIRGWWAELRDNLRRAGDPTIDEVALRQGAIEAITSTGGRLRDGGEVHDRVVEVLQSVAPRVAETGQQEIDGLIRTTIDRWDAEDTSRRLELWMGRDLQFVRINGTVVGAIVGVVLHASTTLLS